jgi:translation initiation factor 4E
VVGDAFDECRSIVPDAESDDGNVQGSAEGGLPEICGCTISVRQSEDIISLWNRVEADKSCRDKIRCVSLSILLSICS